MQDFNKYQSAFSWRYASDEMRRIWSETNKRLIWRYLWTSLATVQSEYGFVQSDQVKDLERHAKDIDIPRSLAIEKEIHHDLMAELQAYAEQCPIGGPILHLGATSADIEDNADVIRCRESLDLVLVRLQEVLMQLSEKIEIWAEFPVMSFTHLQPAEPITLGYRFAQYAQDLLMDWEDLRRVRRLLQGKGFKGAVGTGASYVELIGKDEYAVFETRLSTLINLPFFPVSTQTYPRKQDLRVVSALAGLGGSLYKFAFDLRLLQSPLAGELSEPFSEKQVGSSAMPFKRNPIQSEKIDSLARLLAQMPRVAWDNAAHSLLERTLDDSANRRTLLAESFLITDEILIVTTKILKNLVIDEAAIDRNLQSFGMFASMERVLMTLGKRGADRQIMHARLRDHALVAWQALRDGQVNPMEKLILTDELILQYIPKDELHHLISWQDYVGSAPEKAHQLARLIRETLL
jgi:adenylosuccinate lyase